MTSWAIKVEGVSKRFSVTLARSMGLGTRDMLARLTRQNRAGQQEILRAGEFWALRDVCFTLERGQSLGIMGANGSGKTTLLRLLNGTYHPDAGRITLKGRIGSLIAAGAGFSPMLTGRENIYVNGTLLGLSHDMITRRLDEIIAFSELGEFIDMPVRHYSSGMFVRLGFAIAATSHPDILLVDEVLAVGDTAFQKKCFDYLYRLKAQGSAIILVSHGGGAIWSLCDVAMFLHKGTASPLLPVETVIQAYENISNAATNKSPHPLTEYINKSQQSLQQKVTDAPDTPTDGGSTEETLAKNYGYRRGGDGTVHIPEVRILDKNGKQTTSIAAGDPFTLEADIHAKRPLNDVLVRYTFDNEIYKFIAVLDNYELGTQIPFMDGGWYRSQFFLESHSFVPGLYIINVAIVEKGAAVHLFYWLGSVSLTIISTATSIPTRGVVFSIESDIEMEMAAIDG